MLWNLAGDAARLISSLKRTSDRTTGIDHQISHLFGEIDRDQISKEGDLDVRIDHHALQDTTNTKTICSEGQQLARNSPSVPVATSATSAAAADHI